MAKIFGGFTTQQQVQLLAKMGIDVNPQQDEINKVLMSNPKAASMMGKYAEMAKARVTGGPEAAMQVGGYIAPPNNMQQQMAALDYNKLYANPNKQPSGYAPGGVVSEQDKILVEKYGWKLIDGVAYAPGTEPNAAGTEPNDVASTDLVIDDGPVEYDPAQGLPDPVGNLFTDVNLAYEDAFQSDFNAGTIGQNRRIDDDKVWAKTTTSQMGNVTDPKDYTLRNDNGYFTIVYPDGTEVKTGHTKENYATGRANILAAAVSAAKNVVTPEEKTALEKQYENNLQMYQTYQTDTATKAAADPVGSADTARSAYNTANNILQQYMQELAGLETDDPRYETLKGLIDKQKITVNATKAKRDEAVKAEKASRLVNRGKRVEAIEEDPTSSVTKTKVEKLSDTPEGLAQIERGKITEGTGDAGLVDSAKLTTSDEADTADTVTEQEAATVTVDLAEADVQATIDKLKAATGKPSDEAVAEAATMDAETLTSLGLDAAQIEKAVQVISPDERVMGEGEEITGSAVSMDRLESQALNFEAATGVPSTEATVQGQLTQLLSQFEDGATPPWAAGAMRSATATLAARGLAASSMAGQAIVQAAMESALPIAQADASVRAQFEAQNLSNRQQVAMFGAEQRAKFLGVEFDQEFQTRVANAAKVSDIANLNFSSEVQIALENAGLTNSVDLGNLDAKSAKVLADAAAMTQVDISSLSNQQQAAVQKAEAFLQIDAKNLDNDQQTALFKAQSVVQSILTDQAATNAAEQFNATSENQVDQFYASINATIDQFNSTQTNTLNMFETEQANAVAMFNADLESNREEFNTTNALIIEQANTKYEQDIAMAETAAVNAANIADARASNDMSMAAYNAQVQKERDQASFAFQTANNNADRATTLAVETMRQESSADQAAASKSAAFAGAVGSIVAAVVGG